MVLKPNNEYDFDSLCGGEIKIENHNNLYGENGMRSDLKIVEFNGFMIRGITKIVIESGEMVIFRLYNAIGEIVVEYIMKIYERLVVKNTSVGALKYNFISNSEGQAREI